MLFLVRIKGWKRFFEKIKSSYRISSKMSAGLNNIRLNDLETRYICVTALKNSCLDMQYEYMQVLKSGNRNHPYYSFFVKRGA